LYPFLAILTPPFCVQVLLNPNFTPGPVLGGQVKQLKQENDYLKKALAEAVIDVQKYKKSLGM